MTRKTSDKKIFNVRIDKDLWAFIKKKGVDREMSINEILIELITKYKKRCENKLTDSNTVVSSSHEDDN